MQLGGEVYGCNSSVRHGATIWVTVETLSTFAGHQGVAPDQFT
jgi:hypothetical protein